MMKILHGQGVSEGYAIGTLRCIERNTATTVSNNSTPDEERARFLKAQADSVAALTSLAEKTAETDAVASALMEAHAELALDPDFTDAVLARISEGTPAEDAVFDAGEEFAALFEEMGGDMASRSADVRDVAARIVAAFSGSTSLPVLDSPAVLLSDDLSPSETVSLTSKNLLAFVLVGGSAKGHTAILARQYGIPAVIGLGDAAKELCDGDCVIVDGKTGDVILSPDDGTLSAYRERKEQHAAEQKRFSLLRGLENETKDGRRVKLYCNIHTPDDLEAVLTNDGDGIGLFRSEFLFLGRNTAPTEDEQLEAYRKVLSAMKGREVVIRTLDIGADKKVPYLNAPAEENPALGLRGLRLCLATPDVFRTQLRALYRASVYGNLMVMFPMVASAWEVRAAKDVCASVRAELKAEGYEIADVPLGIMVETPAAALISDELAREADFFSLGTNDLTQYTLAVDRGAAHLADYADGHHQAVLRLIEMTVKNAHCAGIRVGVCGELAADLSMTKTLLHLGVDELSVSPCAVLPVREKIRETDLSNP